MIVILHQSIRNFKAEHRVKPSMIKLGRKDYYKLRREIAQDREYYSLFGIPVEIDFKLPIGGYTLEK